MFDRLLAETTEWSFFDLPPVKHPFWPAMIVFLFVLSPYLGPVVLFLTITAMTIYAVAWITVKTGIHKPD